MAEVRVLCTGGRGFLGKHVIRKLQHEGHVPVSFDRAWAWPWQRELEGIGGDIRDATAVTEAVAHVEGVIHLAGVLGTQETITNPRPAADTNLNGMLNVLEACAQYSVPLVNIGVGNHFENNTYSITKSCAERFTEMYARYRGLRACTVRAFNAYGPGQSVAAPYGSSRVRKILPSFIARALHGEPIQVYGDGSQVMDMVHAQDVARVLVAALEGVSQGQSFPEVPEAGTGVVTPVSLIAEFTQTEVFAQTGRMVKVEYLPLRPGETPGVRVLAATSTLSPLGIDAAEFVPLAQGIEETVVYYRKMFGK